MFSGGPHPISRQHFYHPPVREEHRPRGHTFNSEADEVLEWDQTKGTYSATGNAVAKQAKQKIKAEELIASYDPKVRAAKSLSLLRQVPLNMRTAHRRQKVTS